MRHWWRRLILRVPLRKVVSRSHDGLSRNENHASLDPRNVRCMSPTALYIEGIVCRPVLYESILKCTRSSCDLVSLTQSKTGSRQGELTSKNGNSLEERIDHGSIPGRLHNSHRPILRSAALQSSQHRTHEACMGQSFRDQY